MKSNIGWIILGVFVVLLCLAVPAIGAVVSYFVFRRAGGTGLFEGEFRALPDWTPGRIMPFDHYMPFHSSGIWRSFGMGGMFLGWLIPLGLLALLVLAVVLIINGARRRNQPASAAASAAPVAPVAPVAVTPVAAAPVEPLVEHACPNCTRQVQVGWVACPYCGAKLSE